MTIAAVVAVDVIIISKLVFASRSSGPVFYWSYVKHRKYNIRDKLKIWLYVLKYNNRRPKVKTLLKHKLLLSKKQKMTFSYVTTQNMR